MTLWQAGLGRRDRRPDGRGARAGCRRERPRAGGSQQRHRCRERTERWPRLAVRHDYLESHQPGSTVTVDTESTAIETLVFVLIGSTVIGLVAGIFGGWLIRVTADRGYFSDGRDLGVALVALAVLTFSLADEVEENERLPRGLEPASGTGQGPCTGPRTPFGRGLSPLGTPRRRGLGGGFHAARRWDHRPRPRACHAEADRAVRGPATAVPSSRAHQKVDGGLWVRPTHGVGCIELHPRPRGLASIVFARLGLVETVLPGGLVVTDIVVLTVAMSVVAHGITAASAAGDT